MSAGYDFVPLPPRVTRCRREHAVWHRRWPETLSGTIRLELEAEQPVHIGSDTRYMRGQDVVRASQRIQGRPGVPGSSMKGALRSRYEAVTQSCVMVPPKERQRVNSSTSIENAELTQQALNEPAFQGQCSKKRLCPACALFGRMSLRSRITVSDFVSPAGTEIEIAEIHPQFGPNLHHVGDCRIVRNQGGPDRFVVHRLHGRKLAVGMGPVAGDAKQKLEVIPKGTRLTGTLRLFNVTAEELGGLLVAIGRTPPSRLKVGAGKGRRFGRLRLTGLTYGLQDHERRPFVATEEDWREAFVQGDDRWDTGEEALVRIHQQGC